MLTFVELVEVLIVAAADLVLLPSFEELLGVMLATVVFVGCLDVRLITPLLEAD